MKPSKLSPLWAFALLALGFGAAPQVSADPLIVSTTSIACPTGYEHTIVSCGNITVTAPALDGGTFTPTITFVRFPMDGSADPFNVGSSYWTCINGDQGQFSCTIEITAYAQSDGNYSKTVYLTNEYGIWDPTPITLTFNALPYHYEWRTIEDWGSCQYGSGAWNYTDWAPATACGSTTQTREASCTAIPGSGSRYRTVGCYRIEDDGWMGEYSPSCTEPRPETWQSCDPGPGNFECYYPQDPVEQVEELANGCTYDWETSGFGSCEGGTGSWAPGDWAPQTGCGAVEQSRTLACATDAESGTHSQTVSCRRSDGTIVGDFQCDAGSKPPLTESCTPTGAACGEAPNDSQVVNLDNGCVRDAIRANCDPEKYCVAMPL